MVEEVAVCADFGSTFTKVLLVDLATGAVVAGAEHRTTIDTDVLDGYDVCLAELARARPQSGIALGQVSGVGARKLERYGEALLELLRD